MALTDQIAALATRIATEIKTVRTEIAARVPTARTISTTAPLTGGGDLSANRTLAVTTGTTSGTVALGDHTHAAYVGTAARGPAGGVVTPTYTATWTPDASLSNVQRMTLTGDTAVAIPTNATDGQRLRLEFNASAAQRVVTLNVSYEVASDVASRVLTIASGGWGFAELQNRSGTWRLIDGDPITKTAPLVPSTPYTVTYAATITLNAATGNNVKITATGALTLNVPTNPTDGQMLMVAVLASGASRIVTVAAGIQLTTGLTAAYTVGSGKVGFFGLRYSALSGNWTLLAQTTEL